MYQDNYVLDHYLCYDEMTLKYFWKGQIQTPAMKHEKDWVNLSWLLTLLIYSDWDFFTPLLRNPGQFIQTNT